MEAIYVLLGFLIGTQIIISIRIHNLEHTIYVQLNDIIYCMKEQTIACNKLADTYRRNANDNQ